MTQGGLVKKPVQSLGFITVCLLLFTSFGLEKVYALSGANEQSFANPAGNGVDTTNWTLTYTSGNTYALNGAVTTAASPVTDPWDTTIGGTGFPQYYAYISAAGPYPTGSVTLTYTDPDQTAASQPFVEMDVYTKSSGGKQFTVIITDVSGNAMTFNANNILTGCLSPPATITGISTPNNWCTVFVNTAVMPIQPVTIASVALILPPGQAKDLNSANVYVDNLRDAASLPCVVPTNTPTATNTLSPTPTYTITLTPTFTQTPTPTSTFTQTYTSTPTQTLTNTVSPTPTPTNTWTQTPTYTFTQTDTITSSLTPTPTLTITNTVSPTPTSTITPSSTGTATGTATWTATATGTPTHTGTATYTTTATWTGTATFTITTTFTPTFTGTATYTVSPTSTQTVFPTDTPTTTSTPTITFTPTSTTTASSTPTASNTATGTFTGTSTFSPTPTTSPTNTLTLTMTTTPTFTTTPTNTFTTTYTATPTNTFTPTYTATNTNTWTSTFTPTVTSTPTITYTFTITSTPTITNTPQPTATPTFTQCPVNEFPNPMDFQNDANHHITFTCIPPGSTLNIYTISLNLVMSYGPNVYYNPNPNSYYGVDPTTGMEKIYWDGRNGDGNPVASGFYLYKIEGPNGRTFGKFAVSRSLNGP